LSIFFGGDFQEAIAKEEERAIGDCRKKTYLFPKTNEHRAYMVSLPFKKHITANR